LTVDKFR